VPRGHGPRPVEDEGAYRRDGREARELHEDGVGRGAYLLPAAQRDDQGPPPPAQGGYAQGHVHGARRGLEGLGVGLLAVRRRRGDISAVRSSVGASINRLDYISDNLTNMQENTDSAIGNIMDADYAAETAEMSKQQLLEQAGISVLSSVSEAQSLVANLLQ